MIVTVHEIITHPARRDIDGAIVLDEQPVNTMHAYLTQWGAT